MYYLNGYTINGLHSCYENRAALAQNADAPVSPLNVVPSKAEQSLGLHRTPYAADKGPYHPVRIHGMQALIFDFDGTILDTETSEFQAWQEVYQQYGAELRLDYWLPFRCGRPSRQGLLR